MASTYVNDLRLNEMATGDASGTWGTTTNTNLELIAEAFSYGTEAITTNADTHTTTIADGATDPGRSMFLKYTGALDSACTVTIGPNTVSKLWFIENATTGSQNLVISQGTGANITIPAGDTKIIYADGAGAGGAMVDALASISAVDLKVQDDLTVTDDVTIGGDIDLAGSIDVDGTTETDALTINGSALNYKAFGTSSIMFGDNATGTIDAANYNTGVGVDVFAALTSGDGNTVMGFSAANDLTTGQRNVIIGYQAMDVATTGSDSVVVGYEAGGAVTTGIENTFLGYYAGASTTTANYNVAIGSSALQNNTTGANNIAIGRAALDANTTGASTTAIGTNALTSQTTGAYNTAVGASSGYGTTTGTSNVSMGFESF